MNILATWNKFTKLPGGKTLFSQALGIMVPYSGSIGAHVEELRAGYARVSLRDRRKVRNHLDSVHAIALVNLGEIATGLAFNAGLSKDSRAIVKGLSIEYLKKARGTLIASAEAPIVGMALEKREYEIIGTIRNQSGEDVARIKVTWVAGPKK